MFLFNPLTINGHFYPYLSGCFCTFLKISWVEFFAPQMVAIEKAKNIPFLQK
jgi:hypothetical protein